MGLIRRTPGLQPGESADSPGLKRAEPAAVEVGEGLVDLFDGVHDERPAGNDRFVDGNSGQHQNPRVVVRLQADVPPVALKTHDLALANDLAAVDQHGTLEHDDQRGVAVGRVERHVAVR